MSSPFSFLGSLLDLVRVGVATNWWGLGCPGHCGQSSLLALVLSFFAGLGFSLFLILIYLAFKFGFLPVLSFLSTFHPSGHRLVRSGVNQESNRLLAYSHE